jgi:hypothetical protein
MPTVIAWRVSAGKVAGPSSSHAAITASRSFKVFTLF